MILPYPIQRGKEVYVPCACRWQKERSADMCALLRDFALAQVCQHPNRVCAQ
jgi:hypothetical protein